MSLWDDQRERRVRELYAKRLSDSQIAAIFNRELGATVFTRNAVIGKRARMGLKREGKPLGHAHAAGVRPINFRRAPKPGQPAVVRQKPVSAEEPQVAGRPLQSLSRARCRYAVTNEAPHLFCGEPVEPSRSYCPYHTSICIEFSRPFDNRSALYFAGGTK